MNIFVLVGLLVIVFMSSWFAISLLIKRNDVADFAWGIGPIFVAWFIYFYVGEFTTRALITNLLITVWGARLAYHIGRRLLAKEEDYRYKKWREEWGNNVVIRSFLQVFLLQGLFMFLIATSVTVINASATNTFGFIDGLGILIWLTGFIFESVSDKQLKVFVSNPQNKGKLIESGLWRYSRHPNYFGEVVQWWGIFVIALNIELGILSIISPLTITLLILFVSGVPLLEKKYEGRADFEEYKRKTSVFFPLPPKK